MQIKIIPIDIFLSDVYILIGVGEKDFAEFYQNNKVYITEDERKRRMDKERLYSLLRKKGLKLRHIGNLYQVQSVFKTVFQTHSLREVCAFVEATHDSYTLYNTFQHCNNVQAKCAQKYNKVIYM